MALSLNANGPKAAPNVTPLIDVLLVLLVIFMVITPLRSNELETRVAQPSEKRNDPSPEVVVLSIARNDALRINGQSTTIADLPSALVAIFAHRAEKVVFVRDEKELEFRSVAHVIDIAKAAGIEQIGLLGH